MILSDLEAAVRLDLFDPSGANQRWTLADIDRALDKAVDRYTVYYPNVVFADMASQPFQRTYPYPPSWKTGYPVLWIEKVLYPLQAFGSQFSTPSAAPAAAAVAGAGLGTGTYKYGATFLSQGGETPISPLQTVTTAGGNLQVNLSAIPIGAPAPSTPGSSTNTVIGRNLYRSQVGGTTAVNPTHNMPEDSTG